MTELVPECLQPDLKPELKLKTAIPKLDSVLCCAVLCLVAQSCPTLCDPMDCSPPGSSVRGILQARILEWVAMLVSWIWESQ